MAQARIPIRTEYNGKGFDQARKDAIRMRKLQDRHNRAVLQELKQQLRQQRKLGVLTRKLEREQAREARAAERAIRKQREAYKEYGQAVLAAGAILGTYAVQSVKAAAEAERLERATNALGQRFGVTGKEITQSIQEASDFTIDRLGAMEAANKAMLLGIIDSEDQFDEMARIAVSLGRAMGVDAKSAIDDFTTGLGRQSALILDNLGIVVDTEGAYEKFAKQLGKTSSELTDAEKKQAFVNEALEQGRKKAEELGNQGLDTAGKIERITARWSDLMVAMGDTAEAGGALDFLNSKLDDMIEGAEAWTFSFERADQVVEATRKTTKRMADEGNLASQALEKWRATAEAIPALGVAGEFKDAAFYLGDLFGGALLAAQGNEQLAESFNELTAAAEEATAITPTGIDPETDAAPEVDTEEDSRLQRIADLREKAVRDILRIEEDAQRDSEEAWKDYYTEIDELGRDFAESAKEARKDATKDLLKIEKDFAKDVRKLRSDLARDLERVNKDENRDIARLQERHAKETMRERRMRQIDALADERLFNFEIQQLAAEGEGNRIRELIARREIEQEIEAEKAEEQARQEDEKLQEDIDRVREAAEERRNQLEEDHALRLNLLTEEAEEAKALRQQELAEKLAEETENFQERLNQQKQYRIEKLAEIEKGKQEALKKVGEELAGAKEITRKELDSFKPVAKSLGEQIGANVAAGINQGIQNNLRVQNILNGISSGAGSGQGFGGFMQTGGPFGLIPRFDDGGIVPGPVGVPRLVVAEGGETVLPTHKGPAGNSITINVNNPAFGGAVSQNEINGYFQEFVDAVIVPALQ